jgi:glycosyltransferase involved in cell wall biosynthesis
MRVGFFVPVYNAADQVEECVKAIVEEAQKLEVTATLHVVDDSSIDSTPKIVMRLARQKQGRIKILYHRYENGPSRRENLFLEMSKAEEDYLIFIDVDLATDIKYLGRLCSLLEEGYDIAIGSRYLKESKLSRSPERNIISYGYNSFIRFFFGSRISDHQCGFKGFRRDVFKRLYKIMGYDTSLTRGWFIDAELLILAQRMRLKLAEFGIRWTEGKESTFRIRREIKMIPYVLFTFPKKLGSARNSQ